MLFKKKKGTMWGKQTWTQAFILGGAENSGKQRGEWEKDI